jgi:diaminohydroxyphosphoribosylaminopyrimidine deaminase/5-amino-6-(5-phosphoribosylamino)uracil reductase
MTEEDEKFMLRAIQVAEQGIFSTAPNPWVGCVIVKNGAIVSEGYHLRKGGEHAEIRALLNLESIETARGSTAYVTLEPCSHVGSTPPCADALIRAGVSRVVVAIGSDPDENVCGRGVARLRSAGLQVSVGVCESVARESLRSYLHHRMTGMPFVVAKVGMSLNGMVAYEDRTSKWITSEASREDAMQIRRRCQAILVGVGTVLADNPRLVLRGFEHDERGLVTFSRIIIDPRARLSEPCFKTLNVMRDGIAPTKIFTSVEVDGSTCAPHVEWVNVGRSFNLKSILKELGRRGVLQLLVEGGPTTLNKFIEEKLINRFTTYVAPKLIGKNGLPFYNGSKPNSVTSQQVEFNLEAVRMVQDGMGDIRIDYTVS